MPPPRTSHLLHPTPLSRQASPSQLPLAFIFCVLLLIRLTAALFSLISDCDEPFNYWEGLHLLLFRGEKAVYGTGITNSFQTWEYDPNFAIRSWAYLLPHAAVGWLLGLLGASKLQTFYGIRSFLGLVCALVETRFIGAVAQIINVRCAWFLFLILACNAGLWSASVALLPSSFTLYTTTLALSFAIQPSTSSRESSPISLSLPTPYTGRLIKATTSFALGALLGWPFAIVLSFPFVIEELLLPSGNLLRSHQRLSFTLGRASKLVRAALVASIIAIPIVVIDSIFYGRAVLVPLNIVVYNIMSARRGAGPELYGVEPAWFYLANLALNAGPIVLLLALAALPMLGLTFLLDSSRFSNRVQWAGDGDKNIKTDEPTTLVGSSRVTLLAFRLAPFYLWLGLLSSQPHKEERFMFPAYTAMCLNAAVGLELGIGLVERIAMRLLSTQWYGSRRQHSTPAILYVINLLPLFTLFVSAAFAMLRISGTLSAYHAPMSLLAPLSNEGSLKGFAFLFQQQKPKEQSRYSHRLNFGGVEGKDGDADAVVTTAAEGEEALRICFGKEWHRFPSSLFLPAGMSGAFIKSEFDGILPQYFTLPDEETWQASRSNRSLFISALDSTVLALSSSPTSSSSTADILSLLKTTRHQQGGFNDLNQEEWDRYLSPETHCHLLVDSDDWSFNPSAAPSKWEPRYVRDAKHWERIHCEPFLDSEASKSSSPSSMVGGNRRWTGKLQKTVARILWTPKSWRSGLKYRDFCLLANKNLVEAAQKRRSDAQHARSGAQS